MRILFLHQFAFGTDVPGFTRPIEIMRQLAKRGHETVMISGVFSHITRQVIPKYQSVYFFKTEIIDEVTIYRVASFLSLTSTFRKFLHHSVFMILAILRGLFIRRPDVIIASSPPPFVAIAGYVLARLNHVPFVMEIRDLWPEDLLQEGLLQKGLAADLIENTMLFLYRHADLIVTLTSGIRDGIIGRGIPAAQVAVVTNSVDIDKFIQPHDGAAFRDEIGIKEIEFVVVYAGNHGSSNALGTLIETAKLLKNNQENITFLFVGDGEEKQHLRQMATDNGLVKVIFVGPQPKERMPEVFAAVNASIVPLKNIPIFNGALPNKMLDSMASGKPIILSTSIEAGDLIEKADAGILVEPENPQSLANAIIKLYYERDTAIGMGLKGQKYIIENYSHAKLADKLEQELLHVVG